MPTDERRRRLDAIRGHVQAHDINAWIDAQLEALDGLAASLQR
jgi:trehalose-6-phosphate synthase